MCKGGGSKGDGGAAEREAQRQQNIQAGYNQIQRIFDGYSTGIDPVSGNYQEGVTYYLSDGTPVTVAKQQVANPAYAEYMEALRSNVNNRTRFTKQNPAPSQFIDQMTVMNGGKALGVVGSQGAVGSRGVVGSQLLFGGKKIGNRLYANFVKQNQAPSQFISLFGGKKDVPGFNDDFYNQRATDYINYATPQLEDQYAKAVEDLTYSLARNGRLDSSTAATQRADLQKKYDQQRTALTDRGRQYGNDARAAVERSRADLVSLNSNLANPNQIASEAQGRLAGLQAMPAFEPLAPLFVNVGEALSTQSDLERRRSARYNTGLFTPSPTSGGEGSGRIIK